MPEKFGCERQSRTMRVEPDASSLAERPSARTAMAWQDAGRRFFSFELSQRHRDRLRLVWSFHVFPVKLIGFDLARGRLSDFIRLEFGRFRKDSFSMPTSSFQFAWYHVLLQ